MSSNSNRGLVILLSLAVGIGTAGCLNREIAPADPSTQSGVLEEIHQTGTTKVDILFMVDNSNSMNQEQAVLAEQIVTMARELISPSTEGAPSVEDMHIGIVTSDMGTGGYTIQTCSNPMTGDNGVLQNRDRGIVAGCQPTYSALDCDRAECPWLSHSTDHPDDGSVPANDPPIWDDFGCVATLGTGGCGFEQQLESSLAALTVQSGPGMPNEGFVRDDSLLAIIYVTDEDDCSTGNAEMFNPQRDDYGTLNVRCALNPDELYPISRYYDAFVALRGGDLNRIVVAAITGVPVDGRWNPGDPIEQLREMQVVDPENPNELMKSCDTAMGVAFPPVRMVELVYAFGNNGILESICRQDWTPALQAITRMIQDKLGGVCVSRPLASTDSDTCRVIETLWDDQDCPNAPPADETASFDPTTRSNNIWRLDLGTVEEPGPDGSMRTRRRCEILPADYNGDQCPDGSTCPADQYPDGLQGWFYDDSNPECEFGQVRFTMPDVTMDNSDVRFECLTALCPVRRQCGGAAAPESLACSSPQDCGNGAVCVSHISADVCGMDDAGGPLACRRCSPTLGATCATMADLPDAVSDLPLVGAGGCCAEGFHCESNNCVPDRTTICE
jgi:hypothetical protein